MTVLCSCYCLFFFVKVIHAYIHIYLYTPTSVIRRSPLSTAVSILSLSLYFFSFFRFTVYFVAAHERRRRSTHPSEERKEGGKKLAEVD